MNRGDITWSNAFRGEVLENVTTFESCFDACVKAPTCLGVTYDVKYFLVM